MVTQNNTCVTWDLYKLKWKISLRKLYYVTGTQNAPIGQFDVHHTTNDWVCIDFEFMGTRILNLRWSICLGHKWVPWEECALLLGWNFIWYSQTCICSSIVRFINLYEENIMKNFGDAFWCQVGDVGIRLGLYIYIWNLYSDVLREKSNILSTYHYLRYTFIEITIGLSFPYVRIIYKYKIVQGVNILRLYAYKTRRV